MQPSNYNVVCSFICWIQDLLPMKFTDTRFQKTITNLMFTAGRPKAALLFCFFDDFRCGALLFMVIHVIYKYKNRYK